jgi:hypothetical protein
LTERVEDFRAACTDPTQKYQSKARDLYRLLLARSPSKSREESALSCVPDGPLWDVPFQALHDGKGSCWSISILPMPTAQRARRPRCWKRAQSRVKPIGSCWRWRNPDFGDEKRFPDNGDNPDAALAALPAPSRDIFLPRGALLVSLPGTQQEVDVLKQQFPGAAVYTLDKAQEYGCQGRGRHVPLRSTWPRTPFSQRCRAAAFQRVCWPTRLPAPGKTASSRARNLRPEPVCRHGRALGPATRRAARSGAARESSV